MRSSKARNSANNHNTAIFIMVVSPTVLAHDVSARAGDVSVGITIFPVAQVYLGPFENWETVKLHQHSISV